MKLLHWVLPLVLLTTSSVFAEDIVTSQGTFRLIPPNKLVSLTAVSSAARTAELALDAAKADYDAIGQEVATHVQNVSDYLRDKETITNKFTDALAAHQQALNAHETDVKALKLQFQQHAAEVAASNSLPPEHRDQGNVNRLKQWGNQLDRKTATPNARAADLNAKSGQLNQEKDVALAQLTDTYNNLKIRESDLEPKLGLAYRQLQACANYASLINKKLTKRGNTNPNIFIRPEVIEGALETIKAKSNQGFDTL